MKKITFSNDEEEEIVKMYTEGNKSIKKIAELMGCDICVINRVLKENEIIIKPNKNYTINNLGKYKEKRQDIWDKEDEIIKMYTEEDKSLNQIKAIFNCSSKPICKILKENNIKMKNRGAQKGHHSNAKFNRAKNFGKYVEKIVFTPEQKEKIIKLFDIELLSAKEISKYFNCSWGTIIRFLKKEGIDVSKNHWKKIGNALKNKEFTEEHKENLSKAMKGKKLSEEHKQKIKDNNPKYWLGKKRDKETVEKMSTTKKRFFSEGKTIPWAKDKKFTEEHKTNMSKVRKGKHYSSKTEFKKNDERLVGKPSYERTKEIREKISLAHLGKPNLKIRGKKKSEEHKIKLSLAKKGKPNLKLRGTHQSEEHKKKQSAAKQGIPLDEWKGFSSFFPYPQTFTKAFKLAIKQRDGFQCLKCGMREEDHIKLFNQKEPIHHIDYVYANTFPENCCVLCRRCNLEVNKDRKNWKVHFHSLLSERYGYQYTDDGKPIINIEVKE
ncbi:MAG: NUMOD3 domain-containing DNA-binding protein [Candidatus Woesearchaeota archaeon]|jgi:predicted transcriptional regulator